jgi:hypothetical protein
MSAHLLSASAELIVAILAMVSTASASVVKTWIGETFRTRRVLKALENAKPQEMPEIIRAWAQFEGKPVSGRPGDDTAADQPLPSERHPVIDTHDAEDATRPALRGTDMNEMAEHVDLLKNPLIRHLIALDLDRNDFVIFGSAPLLAHGLRQSIGDLDIVARGTAWRRASEFGDPAVGMISGDPAVHLCGGRIQVSQKWISTDWDTDDLIDRAEIIQGLRFAPLADVLAYKRILMRPKDIADILALTQLGVEIANHGIVQDAASNPAKDCCGAASAREKNSP